MLRLSVLVSIRLTNDDGTEDERDLSAFPEVADWTGTLSSTSFSVLFDNGHRIDELQPTRTPDAELWRRLFPTSAPTRPFAFEDHAAKDLHTFPVRDVLRYLESVYGELAAQSPTDLPSIDDPGNPLVRIADLRDIPSRVSDASSFWRERQNAEAKKQPGQTGEVVHEPGPFDEATFAEAYRFYYRPGSRRPDFPEDHVEKDPEQPRFDFHERAALLGDHPELMRRLGLVLDFEFDDAGIAPTGEVWVEPRGPVPDIPPPPRTRYELEREYFGARPRDPELRLHRGLLRLNREWFDLYQVDVDGAAMKVVDFATTLGALKDPERRSAATPSEAGTPSLRTGGFGVSRAQRGDQLLDDLVHTRSLNKALEAGAQVVLDAEDVIRGFRLDVFDDKAPGEPRWFSLHGRHCRHTVEDPDGTEPDLLIEHDDEGYVKAASASSERADNPAPSDDLYLHEALFGWDGWSLSAPRPGKRIVEPGEGEVQDGKVMPYERYDPRKDNKLPIVIETTAAPRSLPRLRFGHAYRVRARLVDLAGNSVDFSQGELPPADGPPDVTLGPASYLRFEPIPSPAVLRRRVDTEGESLEHVVIRSNDGVSPADYAGNPDVKAALENAGANHEYHEDSQRHVAPPKGSVQMAEQLEQLEQAFGGTPADAEAVRLLALREEGTFLDPTIVDLATGAPSIAQLDRRLYLPGEEPPVQDDPGIPKERGDALPEGAYVLFTGDEVLLPYLPDPLAAGVALTGFDQQGNEVFHGTAAFDGAWPELAPIRLRLSEGAFGVAFSEGVLEVTLPKAGVVQARLSSVFEAGELGKLAIWDWIPTKTAELEQAAKEGRHWMLTPFRQLRFTHAVQQPLAAPSFENVQVARQLGETFASFNGPIACDAKSTGRLDVRAEWTEDVDLVTEDMPRAQRFAPEHPATELKAVAFGFTVDSDEDDAQVTRRYHVQVGWRWCRKCEGLVFGGGAAGQCAGSGYHDLSASGNYALAHGDPAAPGQSGWRWCKKCQALAYGGSTGACPAGGGHDYGGSGNYTLLLDDPAAKGQRAWRWCKKCQGLAFERGVPGVCPAGARHDHSGSGQYTLRVVVTAPVDRISRHEFGDTKYRKVTYRSVATTRFREFFPRTITDDPERIQRLEESVHERHVLSSARPAAPDVVYVIPTFEWDREAHKHVRKGKGVRVYLRRPWFSSGDGELLAVVMRNPPAGRFRADHIVRAASRRFDAPFTRGVAVGLDLGGAFAARGSELVVEPGTALNPLGQELAVASRTVEFARYFAIKPADDPLAPYVTDWGVDPVWKSALPAPASLVGHFPRRVAYAHGLTLDELPHSSTVTIAAHEVFYDPDRRLWYCDLDVDPGSTYFPFVRLALARYQPNSVLHAHLSRVAMTDFIQLAPDRTATVGARGTAAWATVSGYSGRNVVADIVARSLPNVLEGLYLDPEVPNTSVFATLERHDASLGDLGWRAVSDAVKLGVTNAQGYHVTWHGSLPIPEGILGAGTHRLLITETETYLRSDIEEGDPNYAMSPADFVRDRIVYVDTFEL